MSLSPVLKHACKIPANDGGECGGQQQHIGDLLRLRNREENEDEDPPHLEEGEHPCLLTETSAKSILNRLNEKARPREKAKNQNGQIEPPMRAHGMERCRKAADIVESDELVEERHAVHIVHIEIPRQTNDNDEQEPTQDVHAKDLLELTRREQIKKDNPCGEDHTDGPLCHHRKPTGEIHQPVVSMDE